MDINSKDLVALQKIDKEFGQSNPYFWSTYILPNGHFLNPENHSDSEYWDDIYSLTYEHEDFDDWAFNHIGKGYYHLFSDYCMKMNTTYPYIMIPIQRWTPEQINSFRKIVDGRDFEYAWGDIQSHIDYNGGKQDVSKMEEPLMIESFNDDFAVAFDLAYTSADDIIKAINRYYSTGVMLTEDLKSSSILELNHDTEKKFIDEFVRGKDTKELLSTAKLITTSESDFNGAEFILPSGELLDVMYNDYDIHKDVAYAILYDCIESSGVEFNSNLYGDAEETNSYLTDELGWVRVNYGNSSFENRFYCVLPDRNMYGALNRAQYDKLLDFFNFGYYESTFDGVMIFCGDNDNGEYIKYSFKEYIPEEIIKKIKRYYTTGELLESKKRKKKSHYNMQVSTGDVAANIKTFNSMMGGFGEGYKKPETFFKLNNDEANWTDDGEDYHYWSSEADDYAEDYAKAYKCKMSPKDFLDLTTKDGADSIKLGDYIWGEFKELDVDEFTKESQPIYLDIWFDDKNNNHKAKVVGHEGRHRMFALMQKGIKKVDVVLFVREWDTEYDKYHPFDINWIWLTGQFNKSVRKVVEPVHPMSWKKHKEIRPNVKELKSYKDF